jgi:hypothetical protein
VPEPLSDLIQRSRVKRLLQIREQLALLHLHMRTKASSDLVQELDPDSSRASQTSHCVAEKLVILPHGPSEPRAWLYAGERRGFRV